MRSLQHSFEPDAPTSPADRELYSTHDPAWVSGIAGEPRPTSPGTDTGVISLVVLLLVLIGLNIRHVRRLFANVMQDLLSVRRRANAFDDHTAKESRTILILLLQLWVYEGILMFQWFSGGDAAAAAGGVFLPVLALSGVAMGFYIFQLVSCDIVGYVFTDRVNAGQLRRGLNASAVLLSVGLMLPALVSLFYPSTSRGMVWVAVVTYLLLRLAYIIKGFRIFYKNFPSLLYFILYLCTLEIIPLFVVYATAVTIYKFV